MTNPHAAHLPSLDQFRSYLLLIARLHWKPVLQAKLDPSDVVQQSLMQAMEAYGQFQGTTPEELKAWLRQIVVRRLANAARDFARDKRDVAREQSLPAAVEQSSARLEAWLADEQSSPSRRLARGEQLAQLAEALATLPEAQCEAITLHHLHRLTIDETAEQLGRSPAAVAGLLKRGLRTLRDKLPQEE